MSAGLQIIVNVITGDISEQKRISDAINAAICDATSDGWPMVICVSYERPLSRADLSVQLGEPVEPEGGL